MNQWDQTIRRKRQNFLAEAYQVATHRIDVMRNPRLKDRRVSGAASDTLANTNTQSAGRGQKGFSLPDLQARDVIFDEAGLASAIKAAGFDELDKDMLFMKAARRNVETLVKTYAGQFDANALSKLVELAHHYYGLQQ